MIRRLFVITLFLLSLASAALAQMSVGGWERYSSFSNGVSSMIDTPTHLYYVSNGYLFDYNKNDDTTTAPNSSTTLSDNNIVLISYNREGKYLFIAYESGNIDLLHDDGRVVNIPDIKDAALSVDKKINNVWFEPDRTYVATSFGVVILDGKKNYVIDSANYGKSVNGVMVAGGCMLIEIDKTIRAIKLGRSIRSLDNFIQVHDNPIKYAAKIDDNNVAVCSGYDVAVFDYTNAAEGKYGNHGRLNVGSPQPFITTADGKVYLVSNNRVIVSVDKGSAPKSIKSMPVELSSSAVAFDQGLSSVWIGSKQGVANFDVSGTSVVMLSDYAIPAGTSSVALPLQLFSNHDGSHIYVTNRGNSHHRGNTGVSARGVRQYVDRIDGGVIKDVTGSGAKPFCEVKGGIFDDGKGGHFYCDPQRIVEDPDDPDTYFQISGTEGLFKIKDNKFVGQYSPDNSPMVNPWGTFSYDVNIDPEGNLWVFSNYNILSATPHSAIILPAAKRRQDPATVTTADWKIHPLKDQLNYDIVSLFCRKSNMLIICDGGYETGIYVIDTKGTYTNTADDAIYHITNFVDQDGTTTTPLYTFSLIEDDRGRVWVGTTSGVFEITNPGAINSANITFNRIKVPRNDGSNYADYLLGSDQIYWMSVDNSNRKWIATANSGLFLVSENGDRIIENFTAENSPLPTNEIMAVVADRSSNRVYVGTRMGLLCYISNSSPVADNFDNVYAYPNPVRPDYTGWITITGLMDNSLVKIADAHGNVLYQTRSEGGMAVWDGCTASGSRVKTGVYYVFASSGSGDDGSGTTGAVTKILVVN